MIAPVCVRCNKEMTCHKNGQAVVNGSGLWHGDTFKCPDCNRLVVVNFGREPIREGYEPDFTTVLRNEAYYGPVIDLREKQETP